MNRRKFLKISSAAVLSLTGCRESLITFSPKSDRPNILLCIADDATFEHFGAYGCNWVNTPAFDRVASQGLLFINAFTPNAKCAPSRACILTGRNSWQLEEAANHWCYFPQKFKTYPEVLAENGYFVGYTAKPWAPGAAGKINGKPRLLTGKPFNKRKTARPARGISNNDYAENFRDFLDEKPAGAPFCFWYGCFEPHRGYEYASGISKGGKKTSDIPRVYGFFPDNETVRTDLLDYAFEIEHFDRHLGRMLDILEERNLLENTLVIVTADNGMPFPRIKGQEYEYSNHLPMAAMWQKGIKNPGRKVDQFVSFIDLAPTFLELAEINQKNSGMQPIQGQSLADIFQNKKTAAKRDHVLIGKERHDVGRPSDAGYPIRGIVTEKYLYLRNFKPDRWPAGNPETGYLNCDGSPTKTQCLNAKHNKETEKYYFLSFAKRAAEELYRRDIDPDCINNLADKPEYEHIKKKLSAQLTAELKLQNDPRILGNGDIFDKYPYADVKHRNFYDRYISGENLNAGWVNKSDFENISAKK